MTCLDRLSASWYVRPAMRLGVVLEAFLDRTLDDTLDLVARGAPQITDLEIGVGGFAPTRARGVRARRAPGAGDLHRAPSGNMCVQRRDIRAVRGDLVQPRGEPRPEPPLLAAHGSARGRRRPFPRPARPREGRRVQLGRARAERLARPALEGDRGTSPLEVRNRRSRPGGQLAALV